MNHPDTNTTGVADATADRFRLDAETTGWVTKNWGWADLTSEEHRCLWVVYECLREQGGRFYHLPGPAPRRLSTNYGGGFLFAVPGGLSTFDGEGLAGLVVAAFAAHVRVSVQLCSVWVADVDDPVPFWNEQDCEDAAEDDASGPVDVGETPVLGLYVHARKPEGTVVARHPGLRYLEALIANAAPAGRTP